MSPEELKALKDQNEQLIKENADLKADKVALEKQIDEAQASGKPVLAKIPGQFVAKWQDAEGEDKSRKVQFKDGTKSVRVPKLTSVAGVVGSIVPSVVLLKLANGQKLPPEFKSHFAASKLTKESAAEILTYFAQANVAFLK